MIDAMEFVHGQELYAALPASRHSPRHENLLDEATIQPNEGSLQLQVLKSREAFANFAPSWLQFKSSSFCHPVSYNFRSKQ